MTKKNRMTLYDRNVTGPEGLALSATIEDGVHITAWWRRVRLYAEAMRDLDRVVMVCYDPDENTYYLASVEEFA